MNIGKYFWSLAHLAKPLQVSETLERDRSSCPKVVCKKMFVEIWQNSHENTCT